MIIIKTIVLFCAILATLWLIEDGVEKTIMNSKVEKDEFYLDYNLGRVHTFGFGSIITSTLLWTLFYLLSQF
jgi:hypothetical protein